MARKRPVLSIFVDTKNTNLVLFVDTNFPNLPLLSIKKSQFGQTPFPKMAGKTPVIFKLMSYLIRHLQVRSTNSNPVQPTECKTNAKCKKSMIDMLPIQNLNFTQN